MDPQKGTPALSTFQFPFTPIFLPSQDKTPGETGHGRSASMSSLISSSSLSSQEERRESSNQDHDASQPTPLNKNGNENGNLLQTSLHPIKQTVMSRHHCHPQERNGDVRLYTRQHFPRHHHANHLHNSSQELPSTHVTHNNNNNLYKLCLSRTSISSIDSQASNCSSSGTLCSSSCSSCASRPKNSKTSAFIVASSLYGQLLVVICLAFFIAKITAKIPFGLLYFEVCNTINITLIRLS